MIVSGGRHVDLKLTQLGVFLVNIIAWDKIMVSVRVVFVQGCNNSKCFLRFFVLRGLILGYRSHHINIQEDLKIYGWSGDFQLVGSDENGDLQCELPDILQIPSGKSRLQLGLVFVGDFE